MKCLKIFFICFIIFLLLIAYSSSSWAVYQGDNTYTDKNNSLFIAYNSVLNDFINRLANTSSNTKNTIIGLLKNPSVNYYVYYGSSDGSSLINGSVYKTDILYVYFTSASSPVFNATQYNNYQGITTDILQFIDYTNFYRFNGSIIQDLGQYEQSQSVYIPSVFVGYKSEIVTNFLTNSSAQQTESIVEAIEAQTEATQEITESLTSTDYDESSVNIDSSVVSDVDNSQVTGLFTTVFGNFQTLLNNSNWSTVETINIGIPFTNKSIELRSDILSDMVEGTLLATLINVAWCSLFGLYVFRFSLKIFNSIKGGNILDGINFNDEVITSSML